LAATESFPHASAQALACSAPFYIGCLLTPPVSLVHLKTAANGAFGGFGALFFFEDLDLDFLAIFTGDLDLLGDFLALI